MGLEKYMNLVEKIDKAIFVYCINYQEIINHHLTVSIRKDGAQTNIALAWEK